MWIHVRRVLTALKAAADTQLTQYGFPFLFMIGEEIMQLLKDIVDQSERISGRIETLPPLARVAIAVGAAHRLMCRYLRLPQECQQIFATSWAEVISLLWRDLWSPSTILNNAINERHTKYYSGPHCHELGADALPGADEDAASAAIYALEAYCTTSKVAASRAAMQLLTDADARADTISVALSENLMSPSAELRRVHLQQVELECLYTAVSFVEKEGLNEGTLRSLRTIFAAEY